MVGMHTIYERSGACRELFSFMGVFSHKGATVHAVSLPLTDNLPVSQSKFIYDKNVRARPCDLAKT